MATKQGTRSSQRKRKAAFRVIATNAAYGRICRQSLKRLPARFRAQFDVHAFPSLREMVVPKVPAGRTIVVSRLADLPVKDAKHALHGSGESKHLLFLAEMPVEAMPARLLQLDIRNPHRLHFAAERSPTRMVQMMYRLLSGMTKAAGPQPIVDAWVENEQLVLLSPSFDRLVVPLEQLDPLIGSKTGQVEAFEIDEDGRFLYWPHADVHMGWEQFLQLVDPAAALASKQKTAGFNERYGAAIRTLRQEAGLKQSDIKGVTDRHLRRVEHGELAATMTMLRAMASAHGLSPDDYLKKLANLL